MLRSVFVASCLVLCLQFTGVVPSLKAQSPQATKEDTAVKVELLDAGKAPKQKIRFTPKAGDKFQKLMTMKMSQSISMAGAPANPAAIPDQQFVIGVEVKSVAANGDIEFGFVYSDIKVVTADGKPTPVSSAIEQSLKPMVGTGGTAVIDSRGVTKASEYKTPEGLQPAIQAAIDGMKDSLKNLASPVPEEAVGVGAKWKVVQKLNANGLELTQIAVTELTELSSKGFSVKVDLTQEANPQEVKNGMLPPGATMKLESLDTNGEGKSDFEFANFFPKKTATKVNSKANMNFSIAGQNQKLSTDTKVELTFEDAPKK